MNPLITVIDAGGRYGLHPTWKKYTGELSYHLFEPDEKECARLLKKYSEVSSKIRIINLPLTRFKEEAISIDFFTNRAMSSSSIRNSITPLFEGERKEEVKIVETKNFIGITLDEYACKNELKIDFLKLDTEGSEFDILQGGLKEIDKNILGVRSEVAFEFIFEGKPLFGVLHDFMLKNNFFLVNLDYDGKGDYQNAFAKADGKYGILTATDAVWMKRYETLQHTSHEEQTACYLKLSTFAFLNNAPDLAIKILHDGSMKEKLIYTTFAHTKLFEFVDIQLKKHLYSLKWQPGQSLRAHEKLYNEIFHKELEKMNEFMESLILNPD